MILQQAKILTELGGKIIIIFGRKSVEVVLLILSVKETGELTL